MLGNRESVKAAILATTADIDQSTRRSWQRVPPASCHSNVRKYAARLQDKNLARKVERVTTPDSNVDLRVHLGENLSNLRVICDAHVHDNLA